jgi:Flp pilus assembly CpaF family ATPase
MTRPSTVYATADDDADGDVVALLRPVVADRLAAAGPGQPAPSLPQILDAVLDDHARAALRSGAAPLTEPAEARVRRQLRDLFGGAGGLQPLLDNPDIETINIDGYENVHVQYRDGTRRQVAPVASSDAELIELLRELGARGGAHERRFGPDRPELSMQLPDGSRLHAIHIVSDRVGVSIRRHSRDTTLDELQAKATISPGLRELLRALVLSRRNIVISGGPAAGKTTFLRGLASAIPSVQRLITVEDSYELALPRDRHPDMLAMQAREANIEGAGEFTVDQCVRASLRLTPDRVIVGEVRGAEVVTMCKAMSIGIDGSMATVHASSSRQALLRLTTYAMEPPAMYPREAAVALIAGAVHVVVHLDRATDGTRVVSSIREIVGEDGGQITSNEVYSPDHTRRAVPATRLRDDTLDQLIAVGLNPAVLEQDSWGRR